MSDFLDTMRAGSEARSAEAQRSLPLADLEARTADMPPPPALRVGFDRFDIIAEIKRRSPAEGALADRSANVPREIAERALCYARGGACAISVLTEPSRFDGDLSHVSVASAAVESLGVPVMRKDFLTDPYQVFEARAAGAGGILLITRMLSDASLSEMIDVAEQLGLFVLIEAFDADDLARSQALALSRERHPLVGINTRDLTTLDVDPERLSKHAPSFDHRLLSVAESGVGNVQDACRIVSMGYRVALIGTALMRAKMPTMFLESMLTIARASGIHPEPGHS
ncbi:MAG: indole-3-glycerol phosphate synthase TrpC [Pseudomonadota bacterium]